MWKKKYSLGKRGGGAKLSYFGQIYTPVFSIDVLSLGAYTLQHVRLPREDQECFKAAHTEQTPRHEVFVWWVQLYSGQREEYGNTHWISARRDQILLWSVWLYDGQETESDNSYEEQT